VDLQSKELVREIVRKARSASSPGPNSIPYKVYKKFPVAETFMTLDEGNV